MSSLLQRARVKDPIRTLNSSSLKIVKEILHVSKPWYYFQFNSTPLSRIEKIPPLSALKTLDVSQLFVWSPTIRFFCIIKSLSLHSAQVTLSKSNFFHDSARGKKKERNPYEKKVEQTKRKSRKKREKREA